MAEIKKIPETFTYITDMYTDHILKETDDIWSKNWNGIENISPEQKDVIAQLFAHGESRKRVQNYIKFTNTSLYSNDYQDYINQKYFIIDEIDLLIKMFSQLINGDNKMENLYSQLKIIHTTQGPLYVSQKNIKADQGNSGFISHPPEFFNTKNVISSHKSTVLQALDGPLKSIAIFKKNSFAAKEILDQQGLRLPSKEEGISMLKENIYGGIAENKIGIWVEDNNTWEVVYRHGISQQTQYACIYGVRDIDTVF
ncbi:MAG: hypothetical protein GY828_01235 [Candidatus Gracilibacteria bacterium]|nr:hypothetical protein [Candidatus Gracilibacteria bacterium]